MFFDSVDQIQKIATSTGTAVFVIPDETEVKIKNAFYLKPETKTTITIEQVREVISRLSSKQVTDQYIVIRPADKLGLEASNAFLKKLEEPGKKTHFILITSQPTKLLPTILSRAAIYYMHTDFDLKSITSKDKTKNEFAKKLIAARPSDLVALSQQIAKKGTKPRSYTLEVIGIAVEMLYKSYLLNPKKIFLIKIEKLLKAYDAINQNGNIKLQLIANLC